MIRFRDNEVCCVVYDELNRSVLLNYFFKDHMDDIVCVLDKQGSYVGKITYYSLINAENVIDALQKECVILNHEIWKNARHYFAHYKCRLNEHVLLPVVDQNNRLISFAYEDYDANREIRMLKELLENKNALQFMDIYPQYECVKIYEFNELAYFFANYLRQQNISVQVFGTLWKDLLETPDNEYMDCKCLNVYAEGIFPNKKEWIDNLLDSVSAEFECIDHIYEMNIKNHIVQDVGGGDLLCRLKGEKEIIILGSGPESQDVYGFLMGNGIDICCFVNDNYGEQSHQMYGKRILNNLDARNKYKNPIFIECSSKHSAWGFGGTDYYDYIGYKRNQKFFLIRDYVEIEKNNLINVMKHHEMVLLGDIDLCTYLYNYLIQQRISVRGYINVEQLRFQKQKIPELHIEEMSEDNVFLIVVPEFHQMDEKRRQNEKKKLLVSFLKENGMNDYTDYFSYVSSLIEAEASKLVKFKNRFFIPQKVVLGSIEFHCGNEFFRDLLYEHPSVLMLNYCPLNDYLFWICIRLAMEDAKDILSVFWRIYKEKGEWTGILCNLSAFEEKMEQLLETGDKFTSQELFVMFHIALAYMNGRNIHVEDINNIVIYWESHGVLRKDLEDFAKWLGCENMQCDIINVVRNIIMRNGEIKRVIQSNGERMQVYITVLNYPFIEKKRYLWSSRMAVKFEDLKCNPEKILTTIFEQWGIEYPDIFVEIADREGQDLDKTEMRLRKDFDLKPVYNTNEIYFSEFDRLRMLIISGPWQREYGYPYEKITQFTRRELQEMFSKTFRFEDKLNSFEGKLEQEFRIGLYQIIRNNLQKVRMLEMLRED